MGSGGGVRGGVRGALGKHEADKHTHTLLYDPHIIKVGAHDSVHYSLAVCPVHHKEGLQLQVIGGGGGGGGEGDRHNSTAYTVILTTQPTNGRSIVYCHLLCMLCMTGDSWGQIKPPQAYEYYYTSPRA